MKKIIAGIFRHPNNRLYTTFYCNEADGSVNRAITDTLLDLIEQSSPDYDDELEALVLQAEAGQYVSPNLDLPDWGANETNIWLVPPMAKPGYVCISNEYTDFSSDDGGEPQQFTYAQFKAALAHWREFMRQVEREGKEKLVGKRFEAVLPDA